MREIRLCRPPVRVARCGSRGKRVAEKGELESEVASIKRVQVARVVPPLGPEFGMRAMISGKREVARLGRARKPANVVAGESARDRDRGFDATRLMLAAEPESCGQDESTEDHA